MSQVSKSSKKFKGAPFGQQSSRFDVSGIHPKRKLPGTLTQVQDSDTKLGPGYYDIITHNSDWSSKAIEAKASGPGWQRAYETTRMSAMPHLLYKEQWDQRNEQKRKLGPGTYTHKDFLQINESRPRCKRGHLQLLEPRFKDEIIEETPGPGSYGKGGVPSAVKEEMEQLRRSASTVGILENGGSGERTLPLTGCHLGPGNYKFNSFTDNLLGKVTSIRGPYDLYSGDRNKPIREGHLAAPKAANINGGPGQYHLPSSLEEMNSIHHRNHGKFLKMVQYPEKPHDRVYWFNGAQSVPADPTNQVSPATYRPSDYLITKQPVGKNQPGFLTSASRTDKRALQFFTKNFNPVGAGRYDVQRLDENRHIFSHENAFNSKTGRLSGDREKVHRERLRGKDIPEDRKFRVDHIATEYSPSVNIQSQLNRRTVTIS